MTTSDKDPLSDFGPGLPKVTKPTHPWYCRVCQYGPLDSKTKFCVGCGRDWAGYPGSSPDPIPVRD